MQTKYKLALYLSPLALAALLLVGLSFAKKFPEAQSAQQAAPPLSQRPDVTKPLEDKSVPGAPKQHEPTAAELSKKETVASAFLRGFKYQEYQVRSAAEAMPEEKYGYRPLKANSKTKNRSLGRLKCAPLRNR